MEVLTANDITVKISAHEILRRVSFTIQNGEQWAIIGPSGSGKTTLLKALAGRQHFTGQLMFPANETVSRKKLILVDQQHHFKSLSNTSNFYYQQRFNSRDSEDAITVKEYLELAVSENMVPEKHLTALYEWLDMKKLFEKRLIQLSNGENKRLQIIRALLLGPDFLLLDNPFIGLDVKGREDLERILSEVARNGFHIIMATSASWMPSFITHVLSLAGNGDSDTQSISPLEWNDAYKKVAPGYSLDHQLLRELTANNSGATFKFAVKMKNVNVQYDRKVLSNITWEVRNMERWSLSGPNGSGKSTLLSLVNADNPQAYANEIYSFDNRRGTGESIWDIKNKTGFVSPELHLYFGADMNCFDVVASGLFDTIGLFRRINEQQSSLVTKWMELLKIDKVQEKFLHQLSNGEQRLVLLARALVKNPPLLILDEPCQGLDADQIRLFKDIINHICLTGNKTLIYVSHYAHEVPDCVTHFIRLENGSRVDG